MYIASRVDVLTSSVPSDMFGCIIVMRLTLPGLFLFNCSSYQLCQYQFVNLPTLSIPVGQPTNSVNINWSTYQPCQYQLLTHHLCQYQLLTHQLCQYQLIPLPTLSISASQPSSPTIPAAQPPTLSIPAGHPTSPVNTS